MIQEIQQLFEEYLLWLKEKTQFRQIDQFVEITTPFLDRHNDYIQIYAKKNSNYFLLTDDGFTIDDLEQSGCLLQTPKRQDLLKMTLNGFGIRLNDKKLEVQVTSENFSLRKHNLIQAILAINDLFYLAKPMISSLFYEDVVAWLDLYSIRYTPKIKFTGKTGFDHLFDFVIPKSRLQPERILHTITKPDRETAQSLAFAWIDTKEVRPPDSKAYAMLNDSEQSIAPTVIEALRNYDVKPVTWSRREDILEELAA